MTTPIPRPGAVTADLDWLTAASDPRVVAVVLAREWQGLPGAFASAFMDSDTEATLEKARALLDAVAEWDRATDAHTFRYEQCGRLHAAVTALVGEN